MEVKGYSRRAFINNCAGFSAALFAMLLLNNCGSSQEPAAKKNGGEPADPCNDFSDVNAEELEKRKKMGYVDESTVAGSSCGSCGLYIAAAKDAGCGKCLLFKGPVRAEGYCVQYVAKT